MSPAKQLTATCLALIGLVAACGEEGMTLPGDELGTDDAVRVAMHLDLASGIAIFGQLDPSSPVPGLAPAVFDDARPFTRTRDCPVSGHIEVAGNVERERRGEGVIVYHVSGSGSQVACERQRRDFTWVADGPFALDAERRRMNGMPVGLQTTHVEGEFTWERSDGEAGACTFDLTSVRNPDAMKRKISGTICGREIERTVAWKHGT